MRIIAEWVVAFCLEAVPLGTNPWSIPSVDADELRSTCGSSENSLRESARKDT